MWSCINSQDVGLEAATHSKSCLLYTSPAAFRVGAERSIHLSYGRRYEYPFGRARGGDVFSPAFAGERSTLLRRARTFCEGPPELRTQIGAPFRACKGKGDTFSPAFAGERSTLLRRARTFCEGPPELRTQIGVPFRACKGRRCLFACFCRRTLYPPAEGKNLLRRST